LYNGARRWFKVLVKSFLQCGKEPSIPLSTTDGRERGIVWEQIVKFGSLGSKYNIDMRTDVVRLYAKLQNQLLAEKRSLEARLNEINQVLGSESVPARGRSDAPIPHLAGEVRRGRGRRAHNSMSLREAIMRALSERGPLTRHELGQAVQELGYVSKAKDPLNSMGVVLYAKNSVFRKRDGKFFLPPGAQAAVHETNGSVPVKKKRTMSAEAKARISAAQKARWAKQRRQK
jgi:hypothetical protein